MITENILALYAPESADEILRKEKAKDKSFFETVAKLKALRDIDPDGYDEMIAALSCIKTNDISSVIYSYNVFMEFNVENNKKIQELLEKQDRILAIVRSNKSIDHLIDAVNYVRIEEV